ncbi:type IV pilus modification PilV family protein [Kaarinaea lacus]
MKLKPQFNGFTLIELIMVIVLLSISSVGLISMFGQLGGSLAINSDIQTATQLAQECGEHILSARRRFGYDLGGVSDCSTLSAFNGFGPAAVTITDPYAGSACPASAACKIVAINASYDTGAASVSLLIVDY